MTRPMSSPILQAAFEIVEARYPERAIALDPSRDSLQRRGIELIQALTTDPRFVDEARVPQHPQVLRDCRPALLELRSQRVHVHPPASQPVENGPASRVGDCSKDVGARGDAPHTSNLSVTLRSRNHRKWC